MQKHELVKNSKEIKYIFYFFASVLFIVGLSMGYFFTLKPVVGLCRGLFWREMPCRIVSAGVGANKGKKNSNYTLRIVYTYTFDGNEYRSEKYDFFLKSSGGSENKRTIAKRYPAGSESVCYVNPSRPEQAVLNRGFQRCYLLGLLPLVFLFFGGFLLYCYKTVAGIDTNCANTWRGKVIENDNEPVALKSKSPWKVVISTGIFCLFWNGIVTFLILAAIGKKNGFSAGPPFWFAFIFGVFGLLLIFGFVRSLLQLFNPRPVLVISRKNIPLGATIDMTWAFKGRANRIQKLSFVLKSTEYSTYQTGSNKNRTTRTATHTFYEQKIFSSGNSAEISAGQLAIKIPENSMHSLHGLSNDIKWTIEVHGDVKNWPDIKSSFELNVVPASRRI